MPATLQEHPVRSIGDSAFMNAESMTGIVLPNGLTAIGGSAFLGSSIESAYLPDSLASVGSYAFMSSQLLSIRLPDGIASIPDHAFDSCFRLKQIVLPASLTAIGDSAFEWCTALARVDLPAALASIGAKAFSGCSLLTFPDVRIPASLRSIGSQAFRSVSGGTIRFVGSAPAIGENAFMDSRFLAVYPHADDSWTEGVRRSYGAAWMLWQADDASLDVPDPARDASQALVSEMTSNWNDGMMLVGDSLEFVNDSTGSILVPGALGSLTRVERTGDGVVIEEYSQAGKLLWKKRIAYELPIWGGFYSGKTYNFFVFGQDNPDEDDSREVIRVVRYTKNWHRVDAASLYGANTRSPFGESLAMAEAGSFLYLHTCHNMYVTESNFSHQANLSCEIYMPTMSVVRVDCGFGDYTGYASHSNGQLCITDGEPSSRWTWATRLPARRCCTTCPIRRATPPTRAGPSSRCSTSPGAMPPASPSAAWRPRTPTTSPRGRASTSRRPPGPSTCSSPRWTSKT